MKDMAQVSQSSQCNSITELFLELLGKEDVPLPDDVDKRRCARWNCDNYSEKNAVLRIEPTLRMWFRKIRGGILILCLNNLRPVSIHN